MAANPFGAMGSELYGKIFGSVLYVGLAVLFIGVLGFIMWWFIVYRRRFDIEVKIISKRAGGRNRTLFDKAAILYDKSSKTKYFRLWELKRDLPIPKFDVLQSDGKRDHLELYRKSEDDFYFLTPPRIDNERIIKSDGKLYGIAQQEHKQIDTDIAYWNTKRKDFNKTMFDTESMLMKFIPYLPQVIGGVIMIFTLYILMDHLPQILSQLKELTAELNSAKTAEIKTGLALLSMKAVQWKNK
jgi:hypothetical protein